MRIVQVVPREVGPGGVHPYAEALAAELSRRYGIASEIREAAAPKSAPVCLLHYVNYAYQRRGCPVGLVRDFRRWRAGAAERRLVTLFHEVYATGRPWQSSFWLSPVQRALAAQLARASDRVVTSLALYGERLARWRPRAGITVAPVFSTVGEPAAVPPLAGRPRRLAVFGSAGVRRRAYGTERAGLAAAARALGAEEIVDLGPPLPDLPAEVGGVPVRPQGLLPDEAVSAALLASRAGFLAYPPRYLGKSTIFAAYCAHGLLPVCAWSLERDREDEPLPYWRTPAIPPADRQETADAALAWYRGHSLALQARSFRDLLGPGEVA